MLKRQILHMCLIGWLVVIPSADAGYHTEKSSCGPGPADLSFVELYPWYDALLQRIKEQVDYQNTTEELIKHWGPHENVVCSFGIKLNGDIEDLRIQEASSSQILDQRVLKLIRDSIPFADPPNHLPYQRGIIIEFFRRDQDIRASIVLDKHLYTSEEIHPKLFPEYIIWSNGLAVRQKDLQALNDRSVDQ
jgi:hypothetical protein